MTMIVPAMLLSAGLIASFLAMGSAVNFGECRAAPAAGISLFFLLLAIVLTFAAGVML